MFHKLRETQHQTDDPIFFFSFIISPRAPKIKPKTSFFENFYFH